MITKRSPLVYSILLAVWAAILIWQAIEHDRVREGVRVAIINRAKDISDTLGLVMRSQRRFGVISKDRLESALNELIHPGQLDAIALLNATGEVVVFAGPPIDFDAKSLAPTGEHWTDASVTLMNLVDLGTNVTSEFESTNPPIVLPRPDRSPTNRPSEFRGPPPPGGEGPPPNSNPPPATITITNADGTLTNVPARPRWPRRGEGRPPFGRPFWMTEAEYKEAIAKQGVHSVAMVFSARPAKEIKSRDLWLRGLIALLATAAVGGIGVAWRTLLRSSQLELRLVRASELNTRLKEMNFAAAGLAHETKNPLNIIRGLAQIISKQPDASGEVGQKARSIVAEADRVTAQLNEFIHFSRPREVRRTAVALTPAVNEVVRALSSDLEEKAIRLHVAPDMPAIEADEQLLRQALFNLLLNASQALPQNGEIHVTATRVGANEAALEVRDNGPGVPPEHRAEIFKPYFTTNQKGTGLGLAVVQQIVLLHGWEIACLPNEPHGAIFRLDHLRLVAAG